MAQLEDYRKEINRIDQKLAELFAERMQVCKEIGEHKKAYGLPVKDASRETAIIEKCKERISDAELEPYYVDFQKRVMDISCAYQEHIIGGAKIGYSGVPGAFGYIAAKRLFPEAELVSFPNFEEAFRAAETGAVDHVVLPLENNYAGEVGTVMDLMFSGNLYINRVINLEIEHYLIGLSKSSVKKVKTVISHPQALAQCDDFIKAQGYETHEYSNTARAAQYIKEMDDPSIAAIASKETAELYGLSILESKIQTNRNNSTRFGVFSRVQNLPPVQAKDDSCSFILMFTVPHEAGALALTLDIIGAHGFNMRNLQSRPMKSLLWNYYFYVEAEGNIASDDGAEMLNEIRAVCGQLKLAGAYSNDYLQ